MIAAGHFLVVIEKYYRLMSRKTMSLRYGGGSDPVAVSRLYLEMLTMAQRKLESG